MKLRHVLSFLLILFSAVTYGQTFTEIRANRVIVSNALRPGMDTIMLNARDSGTLAHKNGRIYVWNGFMWNTATDLSTIPNIYNSDGTISTPRFITVENELYFGATTDSSVVDMGIGTSGQGEAFFTLVNIGFRSGITGFSLGNSISSRKNGKPFLTLYASGGLKIIDNASTDTTENIDNVLPFVGTKDTLLYYDDRDGFVKRAVAPSGGGGGSGTVTSVSAGTGMSFSTITTTGSVAVDTNSMATRARVQKGIDSVAALSGGGSSRSMRTPGTELLKALGLSITAETLGRSRSEMTTAIGLNNQQMWFSAFYLDTATTLTGVGWYQNVQGVYTAGTTNAIGLYTLSGGNFSKVAETSNNGDLWKGTANTEQRAAFTSTYNAAAGVYWVVALYNQSAQTTQPSIGAYPNSPNAVVSSAGMTGGNRLTGTLNSQTSLPATITASSVVNTAQQYYFFVYQP